jgi:DNA-binding LytR/AlgR family response regulator
MIESLQPDVAFLDIRMPGLSGLEVAARVTSQTGKPCRVVLVTAYDEFALQAFEQAATDYLVKPVAPERLQKTLARLQQAAPAADTGELMQALLQKLSATPTAGTLALAPAPAGTAEPLRWLRVGNDEAVRIIDVREVDFFRAADKYTEVHQGDKHWLVRTALSELERELDPNEFWRIHRSVVVRVNAIAEARRDIMGRLSVHMHTGGAPLAVSRAHAHLFNRN